MSVEQPEQPQRSILDRDYVPLPGEPLYKATPSHLSHLLNKTPRPPRWHGAPSFFSAWESCRVLDEQLRGMQVDDDEPFLVWDQDAEPGSSAEFSMLLGMQLSVATSTLGPLIGASVLIADAEAIGAQVTIEDAELAELVDRELPASNLYLDVTRGTNSTSVALLLGDQRWVLTGAHVRQRGRVVVVVPFGFPPTNLHQLAVPIAQPAAQPLARVIIGPAGSLPQPTPGDICVPIEGGYPITPAVSNPESGVTAQLRGALQLSLAAMAVLRRCLDDDVELRESTSRQMRRAAERAQEPLPLVAHLRGPEGSQA